MPNHDDDPDVDRLTGPIEPAAPSLGATAFGGEEPSEQPVSEPAEAPPASEVRPAPAPASEPAAPMAPPAPRARGGCWPGCGFVAVGLLSAIVGGLIISLLLPALLGVDPLRMLRGGYLSGQAASPVTIVTKGDIDQPIEAVAQKLTPSVVNISVQAVTFNPFGGTQQVTGDGSGVVLSSDGYILTNNHVVGGAQQIFVTLGSDTNVPGKVIGKDPESDLAVIKVDRTGLVPAQFGSSDTLQVGETVVAIGSPFGLEHTVTSGIVSALHRPLANPGGSNYTDLIQTDAAINPGNSGGALADVKGQVVGINTLIESPSGQFGTPQSAGVGFAIPANFAQKVAKQLMSGGKVGHPYLGIVATSVTPDVAKQRKLAVAQGAVIVDVPVGGPAAAAGVKAGDVLVSISSHKIASVDDIFAALRDFSVGQTVALDLYRGSTPLTINVKLTEKPSSLLPTG